MRTVPTPNADLARLDRNLILVGTTDPAADLLALIPKAGERDERGTLLRRRNSVLAIEIMITTSPGGGPARHRRSAVQVKASLDWLAAEYGRERLAHVQLHLDETTPHLTGFIAPTDPQTGRLNARRWIGGAGDAAPSRPPTRPLWGTSGFVGGLRGRRQSTRAFVGSTPL